MRQDQFDRLVTLTEKLTDVVLSDIDPEGWTAADKAPKAMTQGERGDAYWCRKNAAASLALILWVGRLTDPDVSPTGEFPDETSAHEADVSKLLGRLSG
jgi:hypothetical protein